MPVSSSAHVVAGVFMKVSISIKRFMSSQTTTTINSGTRIPETIPAKEKNTAKRKSGVLKVMADHQLKSFHSWPVEQLHKYIDVHCAANRYERVRRICRSLMIKVGIARMIDHPFIRWMRDNRLNILLTTQPYNPNSIDYVQIDDHRSTYKFAVDEGQVHALISVYPNKYLVFEEILKNHGVTVFLYRDQRFNIMYAHCPIDCAAYGIEQFAHKIKEEDPFDVFADYQFPTAPPELPKEEWPCDNILLMEQDFEPEEFILDEPHEKFRHIYRKAVMERAAEILGFNADEHLCTAPWISNEERLELFSDSDFYMKWKSFIDIYKGYDPMVSRFVLPLRMQMVYAQYDEATQRRMNKIPKNHRKKILKPKLEAHMLKTISAPYDAVKNTFKDAVDCTKNLKDITQEAKSFIESAKEKFNAATDQMSDVVTRLTEFIKSWFSNVSLEMINFFVDFSLFMYGLYLNDGEIRTQWPCLIILLKGHASYLVDFIIKSAGCITIAIRWIFSFILDKKVAHIANDVVTGTVTLMMTAYSVALGEKQGKKLIELVPTLVNNIHTCVTKIPDVMTKLNLMSQRVYDFVYQITTGKSSPTEYGKYTEDMEDWIRRVKALTTHDYKGDLPLNIWKRQETQELAQKGIDLAQQARKIGSASSASDLNFIRSFLMRMVDAVQNTSIAPISTRVEPVTVLLYGKSGVGKSDVVQMLSAHILRAVYGVSKERIAEHPERYVYQLLVPANDVDAYWSGYVEQPIIIWDEYMQNIDSEAKANPEVAMTFNIKNTMGFASPQAAIENKGKIPVTSSFVFGTTNVLKPMAKSINSPTALCRRWDFVYEVSLKKDYEVSPTKPFLDKRKWTSTNNEIPWVIYQYEYTYDEDGGVSMSSPRTVTLQKLITDVITKYKNFQENQTMFKQDHNIDLLTVEHIKIAETITAMQDQNKMRALMRRRAIQEEQANVLKAQMVNEDSDDESSAFIDSDVEQDQEEEPQEPKPETVVRSLSEETYAAARNMWLQEEQTYATPSHELQDDDLRTRAETKLEVNINFINNIDTAMVPSVITADDNLFDEMRYYFTQMNPKEESLTENLRVARLVIGYQKLDGKIYHINSCEYDAYCNDRLFDISQVDLEPWNFYEMRPNQKLKKPTRNEQVVVDLLNTDSIEAFRNMNGILAFDRFHPQAISSFDTGIQRNVFSRIPFRAKCSREAIYYHPSYEVCADGSFWFHVYEGTAELFDTHVTEMLREFGDAFIRTTFKGKDYCVNTLRLRNLGDVAILGLISGFDDDQQERLLRIHEPRRFFLKFLEMYIGRYGSLSEAQGFRQNLYMTISNNCVSAALKRSWERVKQRLTSLADRVRQFPVFRINFVDSVFRFFKYLLGIAGVGLAIFGIVKGTQSLFSKPEVVDSVTIDNSGKIANGKADYDHVIKLARPQPAARPVSHKGEVLAHIPKLDDLKAVKTLVENAIGMEKRGKPEASQALVAQARSMIGHIYTDEGEVEPMYSDYESRDLQYDQTVAALVDSQFLIYKEKLDKDGKPILRRIGAMFVPRGRTGLVPKHFYSSIKREKFIKIFKFATRDWSTVNVSDIQFTHITYGDERDKTYYNDKMLLTFPPYFPMCKDRSHFLARKADLEKCNQIECSMYVLRIVGKHIVMNHIPNIIAYKVETDAYELPEPVLGYSGQVKVHNGFRYKLKCYPGDCMGVLVTHNPKFLGKIIGHHYAGSNTVGFGVSFTYEEFNEALTAQIDVEYEAELPSDMLKDPYHMLFKQTVEEVVQVKQEEPFVGEDVEINGTVYYKNRPFEGNYVVHGRGPFVGQSSKDEIIPSCIAKYMPYKPTKGPSVLKDFPDKEGGIVKIDHRCFSKLLGPTVSVPTNILEIALEDVFTELEHDKDGYNTVLTVEEACFGIEGRPEFATLNCNSSAGVPWMFHSKGKKGKREWIDPTPGVQTIKPIVYEAVEKRLRNAKNGVSIPAIFTGNKKVELRPLAKVTISDPKNVKTRFFSGSPLDFTILCKMYFGGFVAYFQKFGLRFGSAVGIDVHTEWGLLAVYLKQKGFKVIAGDFSDFDGTELAQILWGILDYINKWYNDGEENARVRRVLFHSIVNAFYLFMGLILQVSHGNPSGNIITTILNTLFVLVVFRIMWMILSLQENRKEMFPMSQFNRCVTMIVFGDDHVLNISDDCCGFFNQITLMKAFPKIGMKYTLESKDDKVEILPYRSLYEVTFLKRSFRKDDPVFGLLDLDVIREMVLWNKHSHDPLQNLKDTMMFSLMEMYYWGEELFNELREQLKRACAKAGLIVRLPTFLEEDIINASDGRGGLPHPISWDGEPEC